MAHAPDAPVVEHDEPGRRYVLRIGDDEVGELTYSTGADRVVLEHTVVDESRQEKGLGSRLVEGSLEQIRSATPARIGATCPFVRRYLSEHPEFGDLTTR